MPSRRQGTLVLTTSDYSLDLHMRGMLRDLAGRGTGPVHIAASDSGRLDRVARREGVSAHAVRMRRDTSPLHDLLSLVHLIGLYARLRPAVTVYGTPKAALLGAIAAWVTRVPTRIQILHGLRLETVTGLGRRVLLVTEQIALALSSSTVAVSASLRDRCAELGLDVRRVRVLGPGGFVGMDIERLRRAGADSDAVSRQRREMRTDDQAALIGFAGRVTRDKGIVELLDAVAALRGSGCAVEVALVGEDEGIDELPARTRSLLQQPWAHLVGAVPDAIEYIAAFDVLCLPSHREGLPTVVLEAMAAGVPVVASSATGVIDLVDDHRNGLLVPVGAAVELAIALREVLDDAALRGRLTIEASSFVESFAEDMVWQRHRSHYAAVQRLTA